MYEIKVLINVLLGFSKISISPFDVHDTPEWRKRSRERDWTAFGGGKSCLSSRVEPLHHTLTVNTGKSSSLINFLPSYKHILTKLFSSPVTKALPVDTATHLWRPNFEVFHFTKQHACMDTNNKQIKHFESFLSTKGSRRDCMGEKSICEKLFQLCFFSFLFLFRCFLEADSKKGGKAKAAWEGSCDVTLSECAGKLRMNGRRRRKL